MRRIGLAAAAGVAALAVFVVAAWFLGEALMLRLQAAGFSPPVAAGLTGVAGLVVVVILVLLGIWALRRKRTPPVSGAQGIAAELGGVAAREAINAVRAHPYGTMGAALAAGVALGALPALRKSLMGLFK